MLYFISFLFTTNRIWSQPLAIIYSLRTLIDSLFYETRIAFPRLRNKFRQEYHRKFHIEDDISLCRRIPGRLPGDSFLLLPCECLMPLLFDFISYNEASGAAYRALPLLTKECYWSPRVIPQHICSQMEFFLILMMAVRFFFQYCLPPLHGMPPSEDFSDKISLSFSYDDLHTCILKPYIIFFFFNCLDILLMSFISGEMSRITQPSLPRRTPSHYRCWRACWTTRRHTSFLSH